MTKYEEKKLSIQNLSYIVDNNCHYHTFLHFIYKPIILTLIVISLYFLFNFVRAAMLLSWPGVPSLVIGQAVRQPVTKCLFLYLFVVGLAVFLFSCFSPLVLYSVIKQAVFLSTMLLSCPGVTSSVAGGAVSRSRTSVLGGTLRHG